MKGYGSDAWLMVIMVCAACVVSASELHPALPPAAPASAPGILASREVKIKQGKLRGILLKSSTANRSNVEIFLGIPYASPPVGSQRFMPPGSPPPWHGVRMADSFGPVCPQRPPDISNEKVALKAMSAGRYNYLKRLLPYLRNQSEDCLYLNIYAPSPGSQGARSQPKYPVIVFIHGESYEWNAGNPYDGSVLASYGGVVVVTINFRLGILGFLRPGISDNTVSNFGLLDQLAALQWVKENIALFGGDPGSVTLLGHGTGAACANLLLVSPVSQAASGLFQRAILMSGTALADWAITKNPLKNTIMVAQALNCPMVERDDELAACLRRKRLAELMAIKVQVPPFETPFGPVVDGSVVPNEPRLLMGVYKDLFSRYDLMYGVAEIESYHILDAVSLAYGMLERDRDDLLRSYVTSRYVMRSDSVFATILQRYGPDWGALGNPGEMVGAVTAENLRDVLLDVLSDARITAPVVQMADYHSTANPKSYLYVFTHRSKYGDFPGIPASVHGEELPYVFGVPLEGGRFHFPHKYAPQEGPLAEAIMTLWTNFAKTGNPNAPRRVSFPTTSTRNWRNKELEWPEYDPNNQTYLRIGIPPDIRRHYRRSWMDFWNKNLPDMLEDPTSSKMASVKPRPVYQPPPPPPLPPVMTGGGWTQEPYYTDVLPPPFFPLSPPSEHPPSENSDKTGLMDPPVDEHGKYGTSHGEIVIGDASSMALSIVIIIGVCFLFINCLAFSAIYYQRNRLRAQEQRILQSQGIKPAGEVVQPSTSRTVEEEGEQQRRRWLLRQCSASTVDPHTKVRDWIAHEIVQRCSPRFMRRQPRGQPRAQGSTDTSLDKLSNCTTLQRPVKVSVAVDATPSGRNEHSQPTTVLTRSSTCINLQTPSSHNTQCTSASNTTSFHSQDPVMYQPEEVYPLSCLPPPLDINVTSRDDYYDQERMNVAVGDALDTIKRRKYPKVLPEPVPEAALIKRRSLPHPGHLLLLQPPYIPAPHSAPISAPTTPTKDGQGKVPPPPPPRTSTLKREHSTHQHHPQNPHLPSTHSNVAASYPTVAGSTPQNNNVVTQPRVVIKPTSVVRRPIDRTGPRTTVQPDTSSTPSSTAGDGGSDSSSGTVKRVVISPAAPKTWYAQYNKSVKSPSDTSTE